MKHKMLITLMLEHQHDFENTGTDARMLQVYPSLRNKLCSLYQLSETKYACSQK